MKSADRSEYVDQPATLKRDWEEKFAGRRDSDRFPFTSQRPLGALRSILPREAIVVAGPGNTQGAVKQTFPVYAPRIGHLLLLSHRMPWRISSRRVVSRW